MLRTLAASALLVAPSLASAAEVVWLDPPSAEDALRVGLQAGARRGPLSPAAFRALSVDLGLSNRAALDAVEDTLESVRVHENVLDGELLILNGLETPIQQVRILRDRQDREVLVRALLYQGFAADRFWGDTLAEAPDARAWRTRVDDQVVERPWLDAFALDPLRKPTSDDITQAPQRTAFDELRRVLARGTRATLVATELPPTASLVLDGETHAIGDGLTMDVLPGRHFIHVELDGEVIGSQVLRIEPAQRVEVSVPVPESDWTALIRTLHGSNSTIPDSIANTVRALDDEVWFAEGAGNTLRVWSVSPTSASRVALTPRVEAAPSSEGQISLAGWAGPSWLHSGDFRAQSPDAVPDSAGVVNALAPVVGLEAVWDRSWIRYGLGLDLTLPLGAHHVALTGPEGRQRLRAHPHLILGHPLIQGTLGWTFPYHLMGGAQSTVPLPGLERLELRGAVRVGSAPAMTRADGSSWRGKPLVQVAIGVGTRLRP